MVKNSCIPCNDMLIYKRIKELFRKYYKKQINNYEGEYNEEKNCMSDLSAFDERHTGSQCKRIKRTAVKRRASMDKPAA